MSKINDTSKLGLAAQGRELRDDELDAVTGGGEKANSTPQKRSQDEGFKSSNDAPPLRARGGPFCDFQ